MLPFLGNSKEAERSLLETALERTQDLEIGLWSEVLYHFLVLRSEANPLTSVTLNLLILYKGDDNNSSSLILSTFFWQEAGTGLGS